MSKETDERYQTIANHQVLLLLDLNLPRTEGRELLEQIKQDQNLKDIPVIVFTTSANPRDIEIYYRNNVASYILKPIDINKLKQTLQNFLAYCLDIVVLPDNIGR